MATGKVRIFELAKELGMSSKELLALFGRLGLEAKNQLSVVDGKIADLLRAQLGKAPAAAAAPKAAAKTKAAAPAPAAPRAKVAKPAAPEEPIPVLRPVTGPQRKAAEPPKPAAPVEPA